MSEGVIADDVSAPGNFGGDIGTLVHVAPDHEKTSRERYVGENVEQMEGVRIIGPVVEGQCDLLRFARSRGRKLAEPLPSGSHGLVNRAPAPTATAGTDTQPKHQGIVVQGGRQESE